MKKTVLTLFTLFCFLPILLQAGAKAGSKTYSLPKGVNSSDYLPNTLVFRVHPDYRYLCGSQEITHAAVQEVLSGLGQVNIGRMFPLHTAPNPAVNEYGHELVDLSLIYEVKYSAQADLIKTINRLLATGIFLYVEPKFVPRTQFNPNDPQTGLQGFLAKINAYDAWDISKGDTNIVIGITDTGTDTDHPDLAGNIKYNWDDPVNGTDDDNDGYIDNFIGWDLGQNDNNPQVNASAHGSHVSGCAAAVTDNGDGVASPGFKCKFLPVKISDASGALTKAYEGIVYSADMGCQIINCSWGGTGGSSLGQNIIDYATFNKNSLVIAAAGNNGSELDFYPAAFNNVLAVTSTSLTDTKSSFGNYGYFIDVCAPGSGIYSAIFDDNYSPQSGTSMASPVVAGCAGIVKSFFPSYNAWQIGERLRVTCDNIYNVSGNTNFQNKLGNGRVNLLNALTIGGPAIRMREIVSTDNNDNVFVINDTLRITGDIVNYLDPTSNLVVTLTTTSPYVTIIDGTFNAGVIGTMDTVNNNSDPFVVRINPNAPQNEVIVFKLLFQDGLYNDFQMLTETVNVDYINITINEVATTNTSKGRLCYNGTSQTEGLGFNFQNQGSLTYESGFMVGISGNVSDNVRGTGANNDEDFQSVISIQKHNPGVWSDFDTYGRFNDNLNSTPLSVTMNYRSASWADAPFDRFHIFEYTIRNTGSSTLSNLCAGIFNDWDIQTFANNKAAEDAGLKMGYVWCTDANGLYAGTKVLTQTPFNHYAIDNISGGAGGINMFDGYDGSEKYQSLSSTRSTAGGSGTGNDVIDVVGTGPFSLNPGDSVVVAFALLAGTDLADLQNSAQQAQIKYDLLTVSIAENESAVVAAAAYPNPANEFISIPLLLRQATSLSLEVMDATGRMVMRRNFGVRNPGEQLIQAEISGLSAGIYHYRLISELGSAKGIFQKQ
jgi:subtilisin family serine protease